MYCCVPHVTYFPFVSIILWYAYCIFDDFTARLWFHRTRRSLYARKRIHTLFSSVNWFHAFNHNQIRYYSHASHWKVWKKILRMFFALAEILIWLKIKYKSRCIERLTGMKSSSFSWIRPTQYWFKAHNLITEWKKNLMYKLHKIIVIFISYCFTLDLQSERLE